MSFLELIKGQLSEKRYEHSLRVAQVAVQLAHIHKVDEKKAEIAGLLHDYCKEYPKEHLVKLAIESKFLSSREDLLMPQILHGPVAAYVLKQDKIIESEDVLQAIRFHTTGHPDMDGLAKIIFIADYVEPGRKTPNIDKLFQLATKDLDSCIVEIIDQTVYYLMDGHKIIHEDMMRLRNKIISEE